MQAVPQKIAIAVHPMLPQALKLGDEVASYLESHGVQITFGKLNSRALRSAVATGKHDMLIALGGDGTMLRAGHLCAPVQVPILGINLGRFGFLTTITRDDWQVGLQRVLQGDYWLEHRMMLKATHLRAGKKMGSWEVINEVVVGRGAIVRPVHLRTEVDQSFLTTYVADALIVATATGSTAYALASGGPILPPSLRNILIVPVAPHLSVDRAIVLDEDSTVLVTVETEHLASLSADGHPPIKLLDQDQVLVVAGKHMVTFVRLNESGFFYHNLMSYMNKNPSVGKKQ